MIAPARSTPRSRRVDYQALAEFRHQLRRFVRTSEAAARARDLEPQQHQLLLALKGAPAGTATTVGWLAERLQLQHHSAVGLVDRLARKGLVGRRRDPADLRRALVEITPAGESILYDLSVSHQDELRSLAPGLVGALVAIVRAARVR